MVMGGVEALTCTGKRKGGGLVRVMRYGGEEKRKEGRGERGKGGRVDVCARKYDIRAPKESEKLAAGVGRMYARDRREKDGYMREKQEEMK
jgi:hypothetical protein